MARYDSLHFPHHQQKSDDFFLVDSSSSNPPVASSSSNFSFPEAGPFRAVLNPNDGGSFLSSVQSLPDEWSGTTSTIANTPHHWGVQSSNLCGGGSLWPASHGGLDDDGQGKRARIEQPQDVAVSSSSFEHDYHRLPASRLALIGDENLGKYQALQRQGTALEANQRIMNALYNSRPSSSLQRYPLDQLKARQLAPSSFGNFVDESFLRQYGMQHLGVDSQKLSSSHRSLQGQYQPLLQHPINHPVYQVQRPHVGGIPQYCQPRLQVAYGLKPEGMKYPLSLVDYTRCSQVLTLWVQEQRQKPILNSVQYWRNLFQSFYAEKATQRCCLSCYNSTPVGRHAQGLFPMDNWKCDLCGVEPGRGFEAGVDVLPRLFKIKFDSGLLEELFFLELPNERYALPSGHAVFEYSKAVHVSCFTEVRIIKHGRLRVTFNNMFKICAWEFCTKSHEEVVSRKNLMQQVHQLSNLVHEVEKEGFDSSLENLKNHCNLFHLAAKQLAVKIDAPAVNDLGFSKQYIRCLQIAEVVNSMEDLIKFSKKTGLGPIESLAKFSSLRKRPLEDSSPQSSITYLPSHPDPKTLSSPPYHPPPPEIRGYQQLAEQPQQHAFTSPQQTQDCVAQARRKPQLPHTHSSIKTTTAHSAGQQSLPGTPQSEMSDLRSNAS